MEVLPRRRPPGQYPARTRGEAPALFARIPRRRLREGPPRLHRLPSARFEGLSADSARSQVGGEDPPRRQGAGQKVRQVAELPLRDPLQRQPTLLLGSRAREPLHHHVLPIAGLRGRILQDGARSEKARGRGGRGRLHSPHPAPRLRIRGRLEERGGKARLHPGQQAPLPPALPVGCHPRPAEGCSRRPRPLPVRDGHGYGQDAYRRRRREALPSYRQREPRPLPGGPAGTRGAGPQGIHRPALGGLQHGDLQGEPRRLAQGRDRRLHRAVASCREQIPAPLLAHGLRPRDLRRGTPLDRRQRQGRVRVFRGVEAGPHRHAQGLPEAIRSKGSHGQGSPRDRAPPAARHLSHVRLRERAADVPLFAPRRRARRLPGEPHGGRRQDLRNHRTPLGGRLRSHLPG
ncbi:MAG: hypothetical protein BWX47_01930 [candidate division Hyd24-12 bacterium ADurb.Bin004]|nr:MAG: hypothetical protein BWX47_01930 [candidate division Hyd24-12 bacterium ADurb.Bin004]